MTPLLIYAALAGGMGWSIHKKWWGAAVFFGALLAWMLIIQLTLAIMSGHTGAAINF